MNKEEFFDKLNRALKDFPAIELRKTNTYYSELIDDYIEDGMTEQEAVKRLGDVDEIVRELSSENSKILKINSAKRKSGPLAVTFLILGFPLWGSLLLAGFLLLLSFYILLYCPLIVFWSLAVGFSLAPLLVALILPFTFFANIPYGVFQIGAAIALLGLSIILFVFSKHMTKWTVSLSKRIWRKTTGLFKKGGYDNV